MEKMLHNVNSKVLNEPQCDYLITGCGIDSTCTPASLHFLKLVLARKYCVVACTLAIGPSTEGICLNDNVPLYS